jgi:hypothetical protein
MKKAIRFPIMDVRDWACLCEAEYQLDLFLDEHSKRTRKSPAMQLEVLPFCTGSGLLSVTMDDLCARVPRKWLSLRHLHEERAELMGLKRGIKGSRFSHATTSDGKKHKTEDAR